MVCKHQLWDPLPTFPKYCPAAFFCSPDSGRAMPISLGILGATSSPVSPFCLFHSIPSILSLAVAEPTPVPAARARHVLSADGFLMYLCSVEGSIFNPQHRALWQDMNQPLCHYFISSSHNTYLIEDQIRGHSSIEGYIR